MNELSLFLEKCKSQETKHVYSCYLKKYFEFAGELPFDKKVAEDEIIEFIINLKKEGKSFSAISNYLAPVKSFYAINDVPLNIKKIDKFIPERRKVKNEWVTHIKKFLM